MAVALCAAYREIASTLPGSLPKSLKAPEGHPIEKAKERGRRTAEFAERQAHLALDQPWAVQAAILAFERCFSGWRRCIDAYKSPPMH